MQSFHCELNNQSLVEIPPPVARFTFEEWQRCNQYQNLVSCDQQKRAEKIIAESHRVKDEVQDLTLLQKRQVDHELQQKIAEIRFNKQEIEKQRADSVKEHDLLERYLNRVQDCLSNLQDNLNTSLKCLVLREGRLGIDLCDDNVDKSLKKEIEILKGAQCTLNALLEQIKEQARLMRSSVYFIDRDLEGKDNALKIDEDNVTLKETSLNLCVYHGFAPLDIANITLEEWYDRSKKNIEKATKEINKSRQLRSCAESVLHQVTQDLRKQYQAVNEAFRQRIEEVKEAKTKLEMQHSEVVRQANEMTRNIASLEKAVAEKEGFMALSHTRLGNRAQRQDVELCRDLVESELVREVKLLHLNVDKLQKMISEARASLRYLMKVLIHLEDDLNIKTNSLKIDDVDCMTLRQSMTYYQC